MLVKTDVIKYLEFKAVDGSFVLNREKVEKVPATSFEALKSPLMGFFEKRRAAKFFRCECRCCVPSGLGTIGRTGSIRAAAHAPACFARKEWKVHAQRTQLWKSTAARTLGPQFSCCCWLRCSMPDLCARMVQLESEMLNWV